LGPDSVTVNDQPVYLLEPDTNFVSYLWHDGDTGKYYTVNADKANPNLWVSVFVTDTNGCTDRDSIYVTLRFKDLLLDTVLLPDTACSLLAQQPIKVIIKNKGTVTLTSAIKLYANFSLNSGNWERDTFSIPGFVFYNDTFSHTFKTPVNMSSSGLYAFDFAIDMQDDADASNDTLVDSTYIYGNPVVSWGVGIDTITASLPYTISLTQTYDSYYWNTGDTTDTIIAGNESWYYVTVTDTNQCQASDSIYINASSIEELAFSGRKIIIYPNPADNEFNLVIMGQSEMNIRYELLDSKGVIIMNKEFHEAIIITDQIDVSGLQQGIYLINFYEGNLMTSKKLIIR
jgi:hypothetical protein